MPDSKAVWRKDEYADGRFLPRYAYRLDYQGREIVPAEGREVYCPNSPDYDETAKILQKHGIDCMLWKDKRLKAVDWESLADYRHIEQVDATSNFICARIGGYSQTYIVAPGKVFSQNCWVPGRMALWIK